MTTSERALLRRLSEGQRLLVAQVTGWRALERRRLIRFAFGPAGTPDAERLCCYLTDRGRAALGECAESGQWAPETTPTDAAIERSQSLIAAVLGPEERLRMAAENVVLAYAQGFDLTGPIAELRTVLDGGP